MLLTFPLLATLTRSAVKKVAIVFKHQQEVSPNWHELSLNQCARKPTTFPNRWKRNKRYPSPRASISWTRERSLLARQRRAILSHFFSGVCEPIAMEINLNRINASGQSKRLKRRTSYNSAHF